MVSPLLTHGQTPDEVRTDVRGGQGRPDAQLPALLLPVRLEAAFSDAADSPELWLRVYPDQIAIDTHDPRFTEAEVASTKRYWEALWRAGTSDRGAAKRVWQSLAQRHGPTRAAYLAHAPELTPANLAQRPAGATIGSAAAHPAPEFDDLSTDRRREASWARAPLAVGIPERWTAVLERGGRVVARSAGAPIPAGLAFGPTPGAPATPTPDGVQIDAAMRWMVDFDEAVRVGMGLRIPLAAGDRAAGFDRVLVYGLRPTSPAQTGPEEVAGLIAAHRFTDGFGIVPQGARTNNTADGPATYTRSDPGFERSFALEGGEPTTAHDGQVLADALGVPRELVARAEHADARDQESARSMALALWPATGDYFLEQMMGEVVGPDARERARSYALDNLRARGPLPAIRVGETPYGILPTTALSMVAPRDSGGVAGPLADFLRKAAAKWAASVDNAPHITRHGDPDAELVSVLGMDASSRSYLARWALGEEFVSYGESYLTIAGDHTSLVAGPGLAQLSQLGYPDWDPRLVHLALSNVHRDVTVPIVDEAPASEDKGLPALALPNGGTGNYISWLRSAPLASIRDDVHAFPGGAGPPKALLYKVLRQALLTEWSRAAKWILVDARLAHPDILRERELVGFERFPAPEVTRHPAEDGERAPTATETDAVRVLPRFTGWEALAHPMPGQRDRSIADYLRDPAITRRPGGGHLAEVLAALDGLADLPTAELERLFTETLDLFSHRLDAWITSVAVEVDRARTAGRKRDYHIGGYGWLEDLRPAAPAEPVRGHQLERVRRLDAARAKRAPDAPAPRAARSPRQDHAGFVHAPSLTQARVGAVLRNGYLTHRGGPDEGLLSVDLSSARVAGALALLDAVRAGQPLGAVLGYRFERGLAAAGLQVLIQPYRDRFPVVANRLTEPAGAAEAVAASNVVDGRALHQAWRAGALWAGSPSTTAPQRAEIEPLLTDLDDLLDAVGDISIAESVYQIMSGNPVHAGGLLDAVSRGERPPEPEVVRTPRSGIDVGHRVALLLTPGPALGAAWPGGAHPRAVAEPRLDAWVGTLLGDPGHVRCRVTYQHGNAAQTLTVSLAELYLAPLDAVALAGAAEQPGASELEQRILDHVLGVAAADATDFAIEFERDPSWPPDVRSFPDFLVAARAVEDVLGSSRALTPQDLIEPERRAADHGAVIDSGELNTRAQALMTALGTAVADLGSATTAGALRHAIRAAGLYGVPGGVPLTHASDAEATAALRAQADRVEAELARRLGSAQDDDAAFDRTHASDESIVAHLSGLIASILGSGFRVCPLFSPAGAAELEGSINSTTMLRGDEDAPERWLAQLRRVRERVDRIAHLREVARLMAGRRPPPLRVAQLPVQDDDRWLGRALEPGAPPPSGGRLSVVAEIDPHYSAAAPHCGLMIDDWVERIPRTEQTTGLTFHFDQPSNRAPQCVLLGICPDDRKTWDDEALQAVVAETLDLAKMRAVDLESLGGLGQLLPALFFPFNPDDETISLEFSELG